LKRIDFLEELEGMGFKAVVPKEVLQELKDCLAVLISPIGFSSFNY